MRSLYIVYDAFHFGSSFIGSGLLVGGGLHTTLVSLYFQIGIGILFTAASPIKSSRYGVVRGDRRYWSHAAAG